MCGYVADAWNSYKIVINIDQQVKLIVGQAYDIADGTFWEVYLLGTEIR
jgi:hypothetical protein